MRFDLKYRVWSAVVICTLAFGSFASSVKAKAQTFVSPKGEAQNVRVEQRENGIVHIIYDLSSNDPRAVFSVRVEASQDSGTTFDMQPKSVTGDAGEGVTPGVGKRIMWDSGKDVERVQIAQLRFRIFATGGPLQPMPVPTESSDTPTRANAPTSPEPAAPVSSGGGGSVRKWIFIGGGLAAAGAAAAVFAVPKNAAPIAGAVSVNPSTGLASSTAIAFLAQGASDPDGDALNYSWDFGDSSSGSGASTSHTYANAGTFTVTVTVSDGKKSAAATGSVVIRNLTGTWTGSFGSLTFSMNLTQNGASISGTYSDRDGSGSVSAGTASPGNGVRWTVNQAGFVPFVFSGTVDSGVTTINGTIISGITGSQPSFTMRR